MLTKRNKILFAIVLLQAIFFISWFTWENSKLTDPKAATILVKTVPVDPRDYLSGNYMTLRYEFSDVWRFQNSREILRNTAVGAEVFAVLKKEDQWFVPNYIAFKMPRIGKDEAVLKGRFSQFGSIEYGVEKYFISEDLGNVNTRNRKVEVMLTVGDDATAMIKDVLVDGVEFSKSDLSLVAPNRDPASPVVNPQVQNQAPIPATIPTIPPSQTTIQLPVREGVALWLETTSPSNFKGGEMKDGLWVEDASSSTKDGKLITMWSRPFAKESVGAIYAFQDAQERGPIYSSKAMNGLPALKFSQQQNNSLTTSNVVGGDVVIFVVLKTSNPGVGNESSQAYAGSGVLWSDVGGRAQDIIPLAIAGGKAKFFTGGTESTLTSSNRVDDGNVHVVRISRNTKTGTREIAIDGKISASDQNGGFDNLRANLNMTIGGNPLDKRYYDGYISEIIIYGQTLDGQKIASVEKYLGDKWKVMMRK